MDVDNSTSHINTVKHEVTDMKSEKEAEVGLISSSEAWNTGTNSDNCGQVVAKPCGRTLSVETNDKELKTVDRVSPVDDVSEVNAVNKNAHNNILEVQTISGPVSGSEEHVERVSVFKDKVSGPVSDPQEDLPLQDMDVKEKSQGREVSSNREANEVECSSSAGALVAGPLNRDIKLEFDLNEGLGSDDGKFGETINFNTTSSAVAVPEVSSLSSPASSSSANLSAPIAVNTNAAKEPFVPPDDLLRANVEAGWKGSAATSAFHPAEPRKIMEIPTNIANTSHSPDCLGKQSHPPLDFNLNVADERIIEDADPQSSPHNMVSLCDCRGNIEEIHHEMTGSVLAYGSVGVGLDLDHADDASTDGVSWSLRNGQKADVNVHRDFDLNDEPVVDASELSTSGQQQLGSGLLAHQPPLSGFWVNGTGVGNLSTWFCAGSCYSVVPVPSTLSYQGDQSFPAVAAGAPPRVACPSGGIQFNQGIN